MTSSSGSSSGSSIGAVGLEWSHDVGRIGGDFGDVEPREGLDAVALFEANQAHTLRVAADRAQRRHRHADHHAVLGDDQHLVVVGDVRDADHRAVAVRRLDVADAEAAATGDAVLGERRALAVAVGGHREHRARLLDHLHGDDLVTIAQRDGANAVRRPAHRADAVLGEADRHAGASADEHVVGAGRQLHRDHLVVIVDAHRDDAADARVRVGLQVGLLDDALAGAHHDDALAFLGRELAHRDHVGDLLDRDRPGAVLDSLLDHPPAFPRKPRHSSRSARLSRVTVIVTSSTDDRWHPAHRCESDILAVSAEFLTGNPKIDGRVVVRVQSQVYGRKLLGEFRERLQQVRLATGESVQSSAGTCEPAEITLGPAPGFDGEPNGVDGRRPPARRYTSARVVVLSSFTPSVKRTITASRDSAFR